MAPSAHHPQTLPERLIVWTILSTWGLWLVGGLYIVGPLLGWTLLFILLREWYLTPAIPLMQRVAMISWPVRFWCLGMAALLLILFIGHAHFNLDAAQTLKSAMGWAKGWALLALFLLAGAALSIRPEPIYRAVCRLGQQTLILLPLFLIAPYAGLPHTLWVSPLKILGGAGDEYFAVVLYSLEPGTGLPRWPFFAPWSPAAGMVAVIHMICALQEKALRWRMVGIAAALAMALLCQSRLALVAFALIFPFTFLLSRLNRPWAWFAAAPLTMMGSWLAPTLIALAAEAQSDFAGARADSSRVRAALARIALERWHNEAYWFGHAIVERGPHLVEYMMIGSHHSWYGLLFVKGLAGFLALAIPLIITLCACVRAAQRNAIGRVSLALCLTLILYSFGENLEILVYLTWPAMVLIGIALRCPAPLT